MDQHETWRGCRLRSWPHYVRWEPSCLKKGHIPCSQDVGNNLLILLTLGYLVYEWIKMKLAMEVGLDLSDIMLDGDSAPLPLRGTAPAPTQFSAHVYCIQTVVHLSYCLALTRCLFACFLRVTPSPKSTKFGSRYLVEV